MLSEANHARATQSQIGTEVSEMFFYACKTKVKYEPIKSTTYMSADGFIKGEVNFFKELLLDAGDVLIGQHSDRRDRNACTTPPKLIRHRHLLLILANQVFHRWRALVVSVGLVVAQALVHLGEARREVNSFELLHYDLDFLLTVVPDLLDLAFFHLTPITTFASFILLKGVVELAEEILVRTLAENDLKLAQAVLMGHLFALPQELEDLVSSHTKAPLKNIVQILIESFHLLHVGVLQGHSKVVIHVAEGAVEHLLDLVFVGLGRPPRDLCQELILAALCQSVQLLLQIGCVQGDCLIPATRLDQKRLCLACITLNVCREESL